MLSSVPELVEDIRQGRMVLILDDEGRENEGDLIVSAEKITPEQARFMQVEGRGMMCVALSGKICDRLRLPLLGSENTDEKGTAYTISVDAAPRHGVTTGVSAADRAKAAQLLAQENTQYEDLVRPGHMHPLRAQPGGVLVRPGHTEASVDLCAMAGLPPAAVIIEVMKEDGSMARRDDLRALCQKYNIKMGTVADVIRYRIETDLLVTAEKQPTLKTEWGDFDLTLYRTPLDPLPHVVLSKGLDGRIQQDEVLVRMHRQNLLGDVFTDQTQNTHKMMASALSRIQQAGKGALVYLRHDRLGDGLVKQLQTFALPGYNLPEGLLHREEYMQSMPTHRTYGIGAQILRDMGVREIALMSRKAFDPKALDGFGLKIVRHVSLA